MAKEPETEGIVLENCKNGTVEGNVTRNFDRHIRVTGGEDIKVRKNDARNSHVWEGRRRQLGIAAVIAGGVTVVASVLRLFGWA